MSGQISHSISAVVCSSGGVNGQLLSQPVDVSKYPDIADQVAREGEHRGPGIFETLTGWCQLKHLALVSAGVGKADKRQVSFSDGGDDFVVEVGSERQDVIYVFTKLVESDLGLPERSSKVDLRVENVTEHGLIERVPHVVVEAVDQLELLSRIHSLNLGNAKIAVRRMSVGAFESDRPPRGTTEAWCGASGNFV